MKSTFALIIAVALFSGCATANAMYNGSPDWKAPKSMTCHGIPSFPKGMTIEPLEVYGSSFDRYIFSEMAGAMGIFYFDMDFPPNNDEIKGTATYLERAGGPQSIWVNTDYDVTCKVTKWESKGAE